MLVPCWKNPRHYEDASVLEIGFSHMLDQQYAQYQETERLCLCFAIGPSVRADEPILNETGKLGNAQEEGLCKKLVSCF